MINKISTADRQNLECLWEETLQYRLRASLPAPGRGRSLSSFLSHVQQKGSAELKPVEKRKEESHQHGSLSSAAQSLGNWEHSSSV